MIVATPSTFSRLARNVFDFPIRLALVGGALLGLSAVGASARFARDVASYENLEPCPLDLVQPGLNVTVTTDERKLWVPSWGVSNGTYHGYAGPGGSVLTVGAGRVVVALIYPRCS